MGTVTPLTASVLPEVQPRGRGVVDDRRREHERVHLAHEDVESGIGQRDASAPRAERAG